MINLIINKKIAINYQHQPEEHNPLLVMLKYGTEKKLKSYNLS